MKIKDAKELVAKMEQLSKNLGKLKDYSDSQGRDNILEQIAEQATVNSPLGYIFEAAKNITDKEIERLTNLIDNAEIEA